MGRSSTYTSKTWVHLGTIDTLEMGKHRYSCKCGKKGLVRDYNFQARGDLLDHFSEVGVLKDDSSFLDYRKYAKKPIESEDVENKSKRTVKRIKRMKSVVSTF